MTPLRSRVAVGAVLSAMAMVVLDAGMANLALPTLARALAVAPGKVILVITAYQTALLAALLPCAALGERYGLRRVFIGGVLLFVTGAALCVAAPGLAWLLCARAVQGLGGACVMALGVALLRHGTAPERFGAAVGWNALTVALSSAVAPTVGAFVVAALGWRGLFLAGLPFGLIALAAAGSLPRVAPASRQLDAISILLNGLGVAGVVVGAEALNRHPLEAVLLLAGAIGFLGLLVRRESTRETPLVPFDLLRSTSFRTSVVASVFCFSGQAAALVALPFHLQHELGQTAVMSGLCLTPWPLTVAATALVSGPLSDRVSTAVLCAIGAGCLAIGIAGIALWPAAGGPLPVSALAALCGFGFGLFQTPNNRNMFLSAPANRSGAAGGLQGMARLTGQTFGGVLLTVLFAAGALSAPRVGLGIGAAMALCAALVSLLRQERNAEAITA